MYRAKIIFSFFILCSFSVACGSASASTNSGSATASSGAPVSNREPLGKTASEKSLTKSSTQEVIEQQRAFYMKRLGQLLEEYNAADSSSSQTTQTIQHPPIPGAQEQSTKKAGFWGTIYNFFENLTSDPVWLEEGYWASFPIKGPDDPYAVFDSYRGKYPFPRPHAQPWPTKEKFLRRLHVIERLLKAKQREEDRWHGEQSKNSFFLRYIGHSFNRFSPEAGAGYEEYVDGKAHIRWPVAFKGYVDRYNVIPTKKFYDYVMNYPLTKEDTDAMERLVKIGAGTALQPTHGTTSGEKQKTEGKVTHEVGKQQTAQQKSGMESAASSGSGNGSGSGAGSGSAGTAPCKKP